MAYIKATSKRKLDRKYGGMFWEASTGLIYGIPRTGGGLALRKIYTLDADGDVALSTKLDFNNLITGGHGTAADIIVRAAAFHDSKYFVLVDRPYIDSSGWPTKIPCVSVWSSTGVYQTRYDVADGAVCLGVKDSPDFPTKYNFFYPAESRIFRDDTYYPRDDDHSPSGRFDWIGTDGQLRGLDTEGNYLITSYLNGRIAWLDITDWDVSDRTAVLYKEFGLFGARDITDIALDQDNNVMYALDRFQFLHIVNLEPYDEESEDYVNTPHILEMSVDDTEIEGEDEANVSVVLRDMWDEQILAEGLEVEFISGTGEAELYDPDADEWSFRHRLFTDEDGELTVRYRRAQ